MEIFLDAIQLLSTKIGNDVNNCLNVNKLEQNTGFQMVTNWLKANLDKLTDNYSNQILLFFQNNALSEGKNIFTRDQDQTINKNNIDNLNSNVQRMNYPIFCIFLL